MDFIKAIKMIGIFLLVLLVLFMLVGMYYGVMFFLFVLKIIGVAVFIGCCIFVHFKVKNKH